MITGKFMVEMADIVRREAWENVVITGKFPVEEADTEIILNGLRCLVICYPFKTYQSTPASVGGS